MIEAQRAAPRASAPGWAVYLACSWTWVIGMWLPVLLVADFGWPGWLVFIVPNALGAMAMGLWLRAPGFSQAVLARHAGAMRWFSVVTILFHVSFLTWWLAWAAQAITPVSNAWAGVAAAGAIAIAAWAAAGAGGWRARAVIVMVLSLIAWFTSAWTSQSLMIPAIGGERPFQDLLWAAPVIFFGFALCPHLDPTFHRARQACPGQSGDRAFVLGFGLFFPALMVYSLLYAGGFALGRWSYYLTLHIAAQSCFTMSAHWRELLARDGLLARPSRDGWWMALLTVAAFGVGLAAATIVPSPRPEMSAVVLLYYLFLGFYALPFPAYVWIVMAHESAPRAARMRLWIVATLLGAPCLWLGFIEGVYLWLLPAAGIAILAPLALRLTGPGAPAHTA